MNEFFISILTGLSIGFLGSFHCIGMCGPIALSLPVESNIGLQKYLRIFLYNFGRAVTYSVLGFIFGSLGYQFRIWGFQQAISIGAGIIILVFLFSNYSFISRIKWIVKIKFRIQYALSGLLKTKGNPYSFISVGLLNGLLPCGLVYVAIAAALSTMDTWHGAILMFFFGLGTIPVMASLMVFGHLISFQIRQQLKRAVPVFIGMMAIILILRGMNLGIPYLSPKFPQHSAKVEICH